MASLNTLLADPALAHSVHNVQTITDNLTVTTAERGAYEVQTVLLVDGQEAAGVYILTGENRENRALRGNRIVLKRQIGTVYAGELLSGAESLALTESDLRQNFKLIINEWTTG